MNTVGSQLFSRRALLLAALAALCAIQPQRAAAVIGAAIVVRTDGRAPVQNRRVDAAYQQALDEAFRRGLLDGLRVIAPERQSPHDLETWQETILSRAADFVGAWRVIAQEEQDGFLTLSVELEIYRDKLARAARATGVASAAAAVRMMVLAGSLPLVSRADDEELDAGSAATAALEAEFARRGAIIVPAAGRVSWDFSTGASSEENRVALAAASGRKLELDAVLLVQPTRRGDKLFIDAQLIAAVSEATLASARAEIALADARPLGEEFTRAARQIAAACVPRLAAARSAAGRGPATRER